MDLPDRMSGVVLTGHGGPEMLEWRDDLPVPRPGPGDVLIRVAAAGVNNTDINTRVGWYSRGDNDAADAAWTGEALALPRIQGIDVCGHVVAVGEGVREERIGARVLVEPCLRVWDGAPLPRPWFLGSECDGGFARFLRVPSVHAHGVTSELTDVELASFPCSYSTAENLLTRARVGPGERVLVTGASGGVGSAAVQLARARGARVVAVTRPDKAGLLRDLGAEATLARDAPCGRDEVDVVIDLVAGPRFPDLLEALRPGGRYAVSGAIGGPMVALDMRSLYLKDLTLLGCTVLDDGVFAALIRRIETGQIRPLVARTWPLREIGAAQAAFEEKGHLGKFVLAID